MWEVWLWAALCSGLVLSAPRLGESTELAWLLVHDTPQQSPLLLRRITPKSVFLTPTFTSCSEGYRQDGMGRCVKVVKLDQQAQWEFFLQKLNSMYAAPEPSRKENPGPLKLPIPIEEEPASTSAEPSTSTTTTELPPTSTSPPPPTTTALPPTSTVTPATTPVTTTLQPSTAPTTTTLEPATEPPTTEQPFLIVVANTTEALEAETTVTEATPPPGEESTPPPPETTEEELAESVATESLLPMRNTPVRFPVPDGRKRPSSYIRFPEQYPSSVPQPTYWWPHTHSWDRTQVAWPPQSYHSYHRERPHWAPANY